MADEQDQAQRTEEPTPKRLQDARKKGDAPKSQEVTTAAMLGAAALAVWLLAPSAAESVAQMGAAFLDHPHTFVADGASLVVLFRNIAIASGVALGGLGVLVVLAAVLGNAGQARPVFTTERMKPKLSKISPIEGAKRIFGPNGLFNFAKGLAKLIIVSVILVMALWPDHHLLAGLPYADESAMLAMARTMVLKLIGLALAAMLVIGALDFGWQVHSWKKRLRMTREEVRRELKEQEGDPQIKARQRRTRDARARRRMLAAVKDATVLIMNPTHYAVALTYDSALGENSNAAPVCIAKGLDDLALRLKAEALKYNVPVVENPPLARALHASVDLDEEIPLEHYEAVAKIIGFVMAKAQHASGAVAPSGE